MKKQVIIMQGISGSGKSTKAHEIAEKHSAIGCRVVSADDLFTVNGTYNFDPTLLGEAHKQCMRSFLAALQNPEVGLVIVDNTNTTLVEMAPYYLLSVSLFCEVSIVQIESTPEVALQKSTHGVPSNIITRQHHNIQTFEPPVHWEVHFEVHPGNT